MIIYAYIYVHVVDRLIRIVDFPKEGADGSWATCVFFPDYIVLFLLFLSVVFFAFLIFCVATLLLFHFCFSVVFLPFSFPFLCWSAFAFCVLLAIA